MKVFGLIGYPLSHSFSEKYFSSKFEVEGITNCVYKSFPLKDLDGLQDLIDRNPDLCGLNVTIPHKESIIQHLHEIERDAKVVGAVNTIKIETNGNGKKKLIGFNTDVYGFEKSIRPLLKPKHKKALILGTGGSARAIAHVFRKLGISFLEVSRRPMKSNQISYWTINDETIQKHTIIVNTTPLGMYPNIDGYVDIPYRYIGSDHILFDLVYNPPETKFLIFGKEHGAATINGLSMLHAQADEAWRIWQK